MAKKQDMPPEKLSSRDEAYLRASKEIAVKFIETGRLSAAAFGETFAEIYRAIKDTVEGREPSGGGQ